MGQESARQLARTTLPAFRQRVQTWILFFLAPMIALTD